MGHDSRSSWAIGATCKQLTFPGACIMATWLVQLCDVTQQCDIRHVTLLPPDAAVISTGTLRLLETGFLPLDFAVATLPVEFRKLLVSESWPSGQDARLRIPGRDKGTPRANPVSALGLTHPQLFMRRIRFRHLFPHFNIDVYFELFPRTSKS